MKLQSPKLEKRVREAARDEMRLDSGLWKDYKRHRKWWLRRWLAGGNKFLVYIFFSWIFVLAAFRGHGIRAVLVGISLYATATTLFRGVNFRVNVLQGYDRVLFLHFPVSDREFLKHEWKKLIWSWTGAFFLFVLTYSIGALSTESLEQQLGNVALCAALQAVCGAALSLWVLGLFPKLKIVSSAVPIYVLTLACLWLPAPAVDFLWSSVMLVPGGWVSHYFAASRFVGSNTEAYFIVPAVAICLSLPFAFRIAQNSLSAELDLRTTDGNLEQVFPHSEETDGTTVHRAEPISPETPIQVSGENISERPNWESSGWIEKSVARWLTNQDKIVAEFMLAQQVGEWSKRWRTAALISLIGISVTLVAPLPPWILFLPMVASGLWGAPLFGGMWAGFHGAATFGGVIPTYALFPLGYVQISRVMFKANIVRILVWGPLLVAYAMALATRLGSGPRYGLLLGIEGLVLTLVLQPLMITAHFSAGTNDTRQTNRYTLAFFSLALLLLIPMIASVVGLFVAFCALSAIDRWRLLSKQGTIPTVPQRLTQTVIATVAGTREGWLSSALYIAGKLLEDDLLSESDRRGLSFSLDRLRTETAYSSWDTSDPRSINITNVRAACVRLAESLRKTGVIDDTVKLWINTAKDDPVPEVRYALGEPS